jgi:hypothetical protein
MAIAQDKVGQDREDCFARGALNTPDRYSTETDPDVMRVTRHVPSAVTTRLVFELKAKGQEEGEHALEKRLTITKQPKVGCFILKIDGNGTVCS